MYVSIADVDSRLTSESFVVTKKTCEPEHRRTMTVGPDDEGVVI